MVLISILIITLYIMFFEKNNSEQMPDFQIFLLRSSLGTSTAEGTPMRTNTNQDLSVLDISGLFHEYIF